MARGAISFRRAINGSGECYRGGLEDADNTEKIQPEEYEKIVESYSAIEDIPFEWQEITADM